MTPTADLDRDAFDLAQQLQRTLPQDQDAAVFVTACCWMLASLVLQAEVAGLQAGEDTLDLIVRKLRFCVHQLRPHAPPHQDVH